MVSAILESCKAFRLYVPLINQDTQNSYITSPRFCISVFLAFVSSTPHFEGARHLGIFSAGISSFGKTNTCSSRNSAPLSKHPVDLEMYRVS